MRHPKKKTLAQVAACSEGLNQIELPLDISTPLINFCYPNITTLQAVPLAIMLLGRFVSTPSMTFSQLQATRLPAYIDSLEGAGLRGFINKTNLPLTECQRARGHGKPFAQYCLLPCVIVQEGERAQSWAEKVIAHNGLCIDDYPCSKLWLAHVRGEV